MPDTTVNLPRTVWRRGELSEDSDPVVREAPVALVYNGISHAVMMATPADLADLALGFSLSERILDDPGQLLGLEVESRDQGYELAMEITSGPFEALKQRRRSLTGRTGCGLCGVESLAQAIAPPVKVEAELQLPAQAIQRAFAALATVQELRSLTGGVHGAAWCNNRGEIQLLREDVGRHNALDKLLGAVVSQGRDEAGFILLTSRLSYEMVAKAAACQIPVLTAVSAPTALAVAQATEAGMTLVGFVQHGRQVVYCGQHRIVEERDR